MAESGISPLFMPRSSEQTIFSGWNPMNATEWWSNKETITLKFNGFMHNIYTDASVLVLHTEGIRSISRYNYIHFHFILIW